jgi:hypothetical protein
MRFTIATLALGLVVLGLGACGRTDLELQHAGQGGAGADENEGSSAGEGGSSTSSPGGFAGAGGSSVTNNQPPKGGLPSLGGSVSGGLVAGARSSGGGSMVGGSVVAGSSVGRSSQAGSSAVAGSSRPASSMAGSSRPAGMMAGTTAVGGTTMGRSGGAGGAISSSRGGTTVIGSTVVSTGGRPSPLPLESNEELIDDLNDGDRFVAKQGGRVGAWKTWDDGTPGGTMVPDPNTTFAPTDTGDPSAKYAVYVKGSGFTANGSTISLGLGAPYDASKYTGITFWAKNDAGSTYARVQFPDKDTDVDAGLCKMSGPAADMCYDHYGYRISFDPGWNKYRVLFKDLTQDGWGHKGTAFDPSTLFEIIFQFPANATYAVWIDNLAFMK